MHSSSQPVRFFPRTTLSLLLASASVPFLVSCTINIHQPPTGAPTAPSVVAKTATPTEGATPPAAPGVPVANASAIPNPNANAAMLAAAGIPGLTPVPSELRKYADVVTKDAKTSRGLLLYHKVKERHLFEIPEQLLGRDLLWSGEISLASVGGGFNGLPLGYRVLRFERVDNRILLRSVSYRNRGLNDLKAAAEAVDLAPIVMAFPVEAEGSERSLEIRASEKAARETEKDKPIPAPAAAPPQPPVVLPAGDIIIPMTATPVGVVVDDKGQIVDTVGDLPPPPALPESLSKALGDPTPAPVASPDKVGKEAPSDDKRPPAKEKWPVIEVSRLLLSTSSDLIDARNLGPMGFGGVDPTRSLIGPVKVFEGNVEMRSTLSFVSFPMGVAGGQGAAQMAGVMRNPTKTAVVHYSLAKLPEQPMQGRYFDERVGYFTEPFLEYGGERSGVRGREYITRFRLEKKDPKSAISEPVKPITFYVAQEVPEKWRKFLIAGIEDWKPVFEAAGFKNAIVAKLAPTKTEDPHWDAEDARYSVIRWVAMPINNAMGPNVHDPRSGEVISAHVIFWHDLLRGLEQSYFVQAGAADKRVKTLPLSDEVMGELLRGVTTHEIGHTLGLRHNHRAATAYSVSDLRSPAFTAANGTNASIMSYGRYNSIAQPGDGVTSFVPKLGPYDFFAIEWGYKDLQKPSAEEEIAELDRMAAKQLSNSLLAFGGEDWAAFFDPDVQMENIGRERIQATRLSLASLERAAARLLPATTKIGEDYDVLESTYFRLLNQRNSYVSSVVKLIGGVRETRYMGGRGGETFTRTTPTEQRTAIRFLLDEALTTPKWLADPAVLNRVATFNVASPVVESQKVILGDMLLPIRFRVLEDAEMLKAGSGMGASQYLSTVQRSLFREAGAAVPKVDIYRRELQREYVEHLKAFSGEVQRFKNFSTFLSGVLTDVSIDLRPAAMQGLKDLKREVDGAQSRTVDVPSRLHFAQLSREIEKILKIRGS